MVSPLVALSTAIFFPHRSRSGRVSRHHRLIGIARIAIGIAVVTPLATKKLFRHVNTPVAHSVLRCVATNLQLR